MQAVDVHVGRAAGPSDILAHEGTTSFLARMTRSVAGKLFLVVFLVLLLNLGVLGYVNVRLHREQLESARLAAAERMTDVVQRSTSYYMLRNDREALSHIVSTLGEEPGISRLRILNDRGRVGFSTHTPEIGSLVRFPGNSALVQQTSILSGADGRYLSVTSPIPNSPSCSTGACHFHPESEKVLGLLNLNLSLAEADADVRKGTLQFIAYSALAILITLSTIGVLVFHFVHEPVRLLRRGTERLGRGDLGVQLPVRSDDELGDLAVSFNEMSRQLHDAREESNAWAQCLEDRVRRKSAELKRAHDQMMQAEKLTSLGKLAAVVAHEINNPLSGILTYAKLLRRWIERGDSLESHKVDMRDSLQLIENESRRCGDIVRNLLTFARVQPMNISDVDLNRIVRSTMKLVEHKLELGNITPRVVLAADLPPLRGDSGQIEQLLLALVMNAIEAMPREGNLHVSTSSPDGESTVIRIEDDGMGIPPDILPRLFEPFMTTKEEGKGVGLGLAISRAIVDRHGGRIDVQSEAGRGTAFTITIPCSTGTPAEDEAAPGLTPHPEVA
jgi:two-component system, NtrC family, sensor kinase